MFIPEYHSALYKLFLQMKARQDNYDIFSTTQLTPWDRLLLKKPITVQLAKSFPAFYGIQRFITIFPCGYHQSKS
jgi:hypothetical protein